MAVEVDGFDAVVRLPFGVVTVVAKGASA